MVSGGQRALAELGGDIGVVEVVEAVAGFGVGQEEVPETDFLRLVLGLLQDRELLVREAPAVGLLLAGAIELD
ncbi:hypothetical protein ACVWY2_009378 [Bradyrhizobium sp. JR6.1]